MAILLLEGFDDGLWGKRVGDTLVSAGVSTSYGLHGKGARLGDVTGYGIKVPTVAAGTQFAIGFALYVDNVYWGTSDNNIAAFASGVVLRYDDANSRLHMYIYDPTSGAMNMYSPNSSVAQDEWHYVELEFLTNTSGAGTFKWWLDGNLLDSETGIDYNGLNYTYADMGGPLSNDLYDFWVDDIYVTDTTGSTNTANLGPIEVETLLPDGNGNSSIMVGSDGNSTDNYLLVDNNAAAPPASSEYVGSDTEGDKDTYTMDDLSGTPTVVGMSVALYAAKSDSGTKFMRPVVRTSATDYVGDSEALAESYSLHEHVWNEDPNTSAAWLYGAINGMEVGQEVRDS